ncbi:hypothetical protein SASPL_134676 [Salvia splendens]|uniref:Protein kinase domain-containing protein n=1 Tax=Salvia splendens TaxID=180675 RepID=A0A8X8WYS1_SALSN|nr:hypothetical protein SASPL_134676 [Salvia splendens]
MTSSTAEKLCRRFSLAEINLATKDFSREHVIGKGGFGEVYRGFIDNGSSVVAIKRCSHVFTFVKGSFGYFDPSYFISGYLTRASDTYSFGVVLLEVLTGRPAVDKRLVENELCMSMWAQEMIRNGKAGQIVASNLKGDITQDCLKTFVEVVKRCLHPEPKKRLTMTRVVAKLELALEQQEMKGTTTQKLQFWPHWNRGPKTTISARSAQKDENEVAMDTGSTVDVDKLSKAISGLSVHHTINMLPIYVPSFPLAEVRYIREDFQVPEIKHMIDDVIPGSLSFSEDTEVNVVHRVLKYRNEEYFQRRECKKEREFFAQVSKVWHRPDDFIPRSMSSSSEREVNLFHRVLKSGQEASIKWLDDMPEPDFIEQVSKVSSLKHENVAQPIGYCLNGGRQLLAYGFSTRRSLHDILRGEGDMDGLSWNQRINIAVGIARGLCYIHEKHLVHHDLRSSNVFLFDDETAKITWAEDLTGVKSCYDAPEWPQCTQKSNVFSFGVILLELLTVDHKMHPMSHLRTWLDSGKVHEIVDARLKGDCPQKEVEMVD